METLDHLVFRDPTEVLEDLSKYDLDINEHLQVISEISACCKSILELGTRDGVSTFALFSSYPKELFTVDLVFTNNILLFYVQTIAKLKDIDFKYITQDSSVCFNRRFDLLFIDTFHHYGQLKLELEIHSPWIDKYIVMHDTETYKYTNEEVSSKFTTIELDETKQGLGPAILEFLDTHSEWEMAAHYTNNNGLTVLRKVNS